jgi:hypothetical protein
VRVVERALSRAGLAPLLEELAVGIEFHHPHVQPRRNEGRNRGMAIGDENVAIGSGDHIAGRLEMAVIVAALARGAQLHQYLSVGR